MNAQKVMQQDEQYVMHTYKRGPLVLESGKGMVATDADGISGFHQRHRRELPWLL